MTSLNDQSIFGTERSLICPSRREVPLRAAGPLPGTFRPRRNLRDLPADTRGTRAEHGRSRCQEPPLTYSNPFGGPDLVRATSQTISLPLSSPATFPILRVAGTLFSALLLSGAASSAPVISEFMAANRSALADEDGDFSDWIEIHNPATVPVSLGGYFLTDDAGDLLKWALPSFILEPDERRVVFASNKDRRDTGGELHTNFRLNAGGEYLALVAPDGTSAVSSFEPFFPPQFDDQSFGVGVPGSATNVEISPAWNFPGNYSNVVLMGTATATESATADSFDLGSNTPGSQLYMWFDFSSQLGLLPAGSSVSSAVLSWGGSVPASVFGSPVTRSALGIFPVPDANHGIDSIAADFTGSDLLDYYAGNEPMAEYTAVAGQTSVARWEIAPLVQDWIDNPLGAQRGQLMILNQDRPFFMDWDLDEAGKPDLSLVVSTLSNPDGPPLWVYFDNPTPGQTNSGGVRSGPLFGPVTEDPAQPVTGPLTITAEVTGSVSPVAGVQLFYRRMFGGESILNMVDDGSGPDEEDGDGVYTAVIPANAIVPGEMVRWRYTAFDVAGNETREPAYRDPGDSHQYFGTVGHDAERESNLSILEWFIQNPAGANNTVGTRGALYYLGQFYDNVYFNRHGQSTGGFIKKSYNIDFNRTRRFQWSPDPDIPRVADIDLLTNWADKSKVRHPLAYEIMRDSGVPAHFAFTVRVEQNGEFFSVADFVEDGDDRYLERAGLNPEGALYKAYSNRLTGSANSGFEKKNRKFEDNSDLQGLIDNLTLSGQARLNYLYDHIDIPKCVNLLAANSVIRNIDMHSKNWYIYRDTGRTNEWALLPWDLDLSGGRVWNRTNTYFDNELYTSSLVVTGSSIQLVSHMFGDADMRSMIMRRIRTLADTYLQPPGTPLQERWYERRLDEQAALIDPPAIVPSDAQRDFEKWGSWIQGSESVANGSYRGAPVPHTSAHPDVESMAEGIARWKTEYLPGRRDEIYNNQTVGNGGEIPAPQAGSAAVQFTPLVEAGAPCHALVPGDDSLGVTWIGTPTQEPFDVAGWKAGTTGVGYERGSGYQTLIGTDMNAEMRSNASVYVRIPFTVADPRAFDRLELRMQWDDGFVAFLNGTLVASQNAPNQVAWDSAALNANHEASVSSFDIYDVSQYVNSLVAGQNILAIHGLNQGTGSSDMIIRPELYGGVEQEGPPGEPIIEFGALEFAPLSGNQDEEYIELVNPNGIAVDISGWKIDGGVEFTFQGGTVIPAGGRLYVSPDVNAFRARTESPRGGEGLFLQGGYAGHLSSFGETLILQDSSGDEISSISYVGDPSDAQRYLRITEIMYHPADPGLAEFVEVTNTSDTLTIDLTDVRFTEGIDFDFSGSAITSLGPGERVLVVRSLEAFEAAHGPGLPVAGVFANGTVLNNDGETLKLEDSLNGTIAEFRFNDASPWPREADGQGRSLVFLAPGAGLDPTEAASWRVSVAPGGNPGTSDALELPANPLGDEDGNGIVDLLDYALGNHLGEAPLPVRVTFEDYALGGQLVALPTLTYPASLGAESANIAIEYSRDLSLWEDAAARAEVVDAVVRADGRSLVTVRINPPGGTGSRFFMRLRVSVR